MASVACALSTEKHPFGSYARERPKRAAPHKKLRCPKPNMRNTADVVEVAWSDKATTVQREPEDCSSCTDKVSDMPLLLSTGKIDQDWENRTDAAAFLIANLMTTRAPIIKNVPMPKFRPSRHVRFDMDAITVHEVIPYSEIYGAHPRDFVLDRSSCMIPAAFGGFVSLASLVSDQDNDEDEGSDTSSDDEAVKVSDKDSDEDEGSDTSSDDEAVKYVIV